MEAQQIFGFMQNFLSSEGFRRKFSQLTNCIVEQNRIFDSLIDYKSSIDSSSYDVSNIFSISEDLMIPTHFIDPVSGKIYFEPVVESSGKTWEKSELLKVSPHANYFNNLDLKRQIKEFMKTVDKNKIKGKLYKQTKTSLERIENFLDSNHKNFGLLEKLMKAKSFKKEDIKNFIIPIFSVDTNSGAASYIIKNMEKSFFEEENRNQFEAFLATCFINETGDIVRYIRNNYPEAYDRPFGCCVGGWKTYGEFEKFVDEFLEYAIFFKKIGHNADHFNLHSNAFACEDIRKIKYLQEKQYPFPEEKDGKLYTKADESDEITIFQYVLKKSSVEFIEYAFSDKVVYDRKFESVEGERKFFEYLFDRSFEQTLKILLLPVFRPFKDEIIEAIHSSFKGEKITEIMRKNVYLTIVNSF